MLYEGSILPNICTESLDQSLVDTWKSRYLTRAVKASERSRGVETLGGVTRIWSAFAGGPNKICDVAVAVNWTQSSETSPLSDEKKVLCSESSACDQRRDVREPPFRCHQGQTASVNANFLERMRLGAAQLPLTSVVAPISSRATTRVGTM